MTRSLRLLVGLATLHTSLLTVSIVAGGKLVALPFGLSASATVLSYTLTFVILDTLADLYGGAVASFVIAVGLIGMMLAAVYLELTAIAPPAANFGDQEAFARVLSASWRIWAAGWCAYTVSQPLDSWVYLTLKRTGIVGGTVGARAWISLFIGQLVDTIVFVAIAFWGMAPLVQIILGQYLVKLIVATISVPLVSISVGLARRLVQSSDLVEGQSLPLQPPSGR